MSVRRGLHVTPRAGKGRPPAGVQLPPATRPVLPAGVPDRSVITRDGR